MKKYLLKGKAYLHQKMQELEIDHDPLDLVTEQIPKKYQQLFTVLETTEFDLDSLEKYSLYYRTYPNHPVSPLLLDKIAHQGSVLEPTYAEPLRLQKAKVPVLDQDLEEKAYKLRNIVESYDQGLPEEVDDLLGIGVVEFHHKRGAEMQFVYPQSEEVQKTFDSVIPYAMPDSSHNKSEDCSFFNLELEIGGRVRMVFGVSYFRQIRVSEEMKRRNEELTRSHFQIAVCILSHTPLFDHFRLRIVTATNAFFNDLNDHGPIKTCFQELKAQMVTNLRTVGLAELHTGIDRRSLLSKFKAGLYRIYQSILFNKRVVFYSQSSYVTSSGILTMLSLLPGQLVFGMRSVILQVCPRSFTKVTRSLEESLLETLFKKQHRS